MGEEGAIAERPQVAQNLTAIQVKAGLDLILQVMQKTMTKGIDYGVIPGCGDKPTLYKPGSEKILTAFRIGVEPIVEDLSTPDEARFRVKTRLFHEPTGIEVGFGIGECSSDEEKYKWRRPVCEKEFEATTEDRRREVWKKKDNSVFLAKQVRTNKADVSNTVLKMAKKRSQIDATLTATAASAVFNQDLEDMEKEVREAVIEGEAERDPAQKIDPPKPKPAAQAEKPAGSSSDAPKISEAQRKRFFAIWKGSGKEEGAVKAYLKEHFGSEHSADITRDGYDAACEWAAAK